MSLIPHEFLYFFENEEISVLELKRKDQSESAFPDQIYFWILWDKKKSALQRLDFRSMTTELVNGNNINVRVFQKGELRFDPSFAKFVHVDKSYLLENKQPASVPSGLRDRILKFIVEEN